jgi:glycosyltransferase involved in cell wall biosynthesis
MERLKICFVSQSIYPLLNQNVRERHIGGAELQQLLIGRELDRRGYRVSFVTMDFGQPPRELIGPFQVLSTFSPSAGVPGLRFIYPRLIKILLALYRAKADVYYVRCAGFILAPVVFVARLLHRKAVFCGASNVDFDPGSVELRGGRDRTMYFWGLKNCDAVVVQNETQRESLSRHFYRPAPVIPNGFPREFSRAARRPENPEASVIWAGSFRRYKNPDVFLELAKRIPRGQFVMIGGSSSLSSREELNLCKEMIRKSSGISNLKLTGLIPFEEVEEYLFRAKLLVNTSEYEGFPNTFLQAWSKGVPVISFVDPDNLLESKGLGKAVKDIDEMVQAVDSVLNSRINFPSERIKAYFDDHFLIEGVVDRYESLFRSLYRNRSLKRRKERKVMGWLKI